MRGENSGISLTDLLRQMIVQPPISHPSVPEIYHSPFSGQHEHRPEIENSDRRLRDTDDKARSVKVEKMRFESTWFAGRRHLETVSKKKLYFFL